MRWLRGLVPTVIILLCALVFGFICYVSIWGVPSFVVVRVEQALLEKGVPVNIGTLKVSIWPRAVVTLKDVEMLDPEAPPENRRPIAWLHEADISLNWKKLLDGQVDPERVNVEGLSVSMPVDKERPERVFSVAGLNAEIDLNRPGMVDLTKAEAVVQGIRVTAQGSFPAGQEEGGDFVLTPGDVAAVRKQLDRVLEYLDRVKWPESAPPQLAVNLSDDMKGGGIRVGLDFQAPSLQYGRIRVKDLMFSGDYSDSVIMARRFTMRDAETAGFMRLSLQADLKKRSLIWDVTSTAPLVSWTVSFLNESLVPREMKFLSEPHVQMSGRLVFTEGWEGVDQVKLLGSGSMGAFSVFGEKFSKASGDFSYENGNFYVTDLDIRHQGGSFSGKVMGVDGEIKVDIHSTLPVNAMLNMARSMAPEDVELPPTLVINGDPELNAAGTLRMGVDWSGPVRVDRLKLDAAVRDVAYQGVEFDSATAKVEVIGKSINVTLLELVREDGRMKLDGSYLGTDLVFTVESDLKPEILVALGGKSVPVPEELKIPEKATLRVHGRLDIPEGKPVEPTLVRARIKAENLAWNKVPVKTADLEVEYRPNQLFVQNCRIELEKGKFELFANGFLDGQMFVMGQSTVPLDTIDKLMAMKDDDFFMERFAFHGNSGINLSFQGTLGLYNLEKAYDIEAVVSVANTKYKGVEIKSARADAHLVTDQLVLTNVALTVSNSDYLSSAGLSGGPADSSLKAKSIDFRFVPDTVEVLGLEGQAYPAHTLRMFSDAAAKVLREFVFTRPVTLSGGGMFPMGDDLKLMKGRIRFDASAGRVRYKILGTTLDLGRTKGEVLISPQWVVVDKLQGTIWEGSFTGRVLAQIDGGDALNGSFVLQDMNLTAIGKSYGEKMEKATVHGAIEFSSKGGNMNSIQAKGEAALVHGNLVEIPIFGFLGEALANYIPGLGHLINYKLTRADCDFSIEKGYIRTNNFVATGSNLSLKGGGWIRLADLQVNSDFQMGFRGIPQLLTSPVFLLARGLFQVRGRGPLNNVNWSFAPFSGGKAPAPPAPPAARPARRR